MINQHAILIAVGVLLGLNLPGRAQEQEPERSLGEIAGRLPEQKETTNVAHVHTNEDSNTTAGVAARTEEIAAKSEIKRAAVVTGYTSFVTTYKPGDHLLMVTAFNPILLVPLGRRWLIETEFELEGNFEREVDSGRWGRTLDKGVEYAQLDYIASRHLTVVVGRFLSPFGIFNERLHPSWIKKLQATPLIFPIGTGSSNGAMLRGGIRIGSGVKLNYATYFSGSTTVRSIEAKRAAGVRWGVVFPNRRLEIGNSFQRLLQDERFNAYGFDATWLPLRAPLEFRAEYARSKMGSGYWVEGAYRFFRKAEVVARAEQFLTRPAVDGPVMGTEEEGGHGTLPTVDTQRLLLGWNYYFRDGLRFGFGYGREFTAKGNSNLLSVAFAYRFLR